MAAGAAGTSLVRVAGWASAAAAGSAGWEADAAAGAWWGGGQVGRRLAACFVVCLAGFGSSLGSRHVAAAVLLRRRLRALFAWALGRVTWVAAPWAAPEATGAASARAAALVHVGRRVGVDNCIAGCAGGGGFEPRPRGLGQDELTD